MASVECGREPWWDRVVQWSYHEVMQELCMTCGRDTAPGSRLFASRKRGLDTLTNDEGFLCLSCQAGGAMIGPDQVIPVSGRYAIINMQGMQNG